MRPIVPRGSGARDGGGGPSQTGGPLGGGGCWTFVAFRPECGLIIG